MTFEEQILAFYQLHGRRHLVPYIGDAYLHPKPGDLRVIAVGINAYLSSPVFETAPEDVGQWFCNWWKDAAHGEDTWPYYTKAYTETDRIALGVKGSPYFRGLHYVSDPSLKPCLYATNAIKEFLSKDHKNATTITPELLRPATRTWQAELDLMAEHGVFPHLVVVFGGVIWESIWKSFAPEHTPDYQHFQILEYCPCADEKSPIFHRSNLIRIALPKSEQTVLLVRLDHPTTKRAKRKDAQWLLNQPDFQILTGLDSSPV